MKIPQWNKRFLASTRGRIIALLRPSSRTVNELAEALELTDNAVRAHLTALERDGLVRQSGIDQQPGDPCHPFQVINGKLHSTHSERVALSSRELLISLNRITRIPPRFPPSSDP